MIRFKRDSTSAWFRLSDYGWGLIALHRDVKPLFSERNGYRTFWPKWPARWRIGVLRPY